MFLVLSIVDAITSIYWILSVMMFKTAEQIYLSHNLCSFFSFIYLFQFTFMFLYLLCILLHFISLNYNSINAILKPIYVFAKYLIISGGISLAETILAIIFNKLGTSVS
jgi:hypothetical protein